MKLSGPPRPSAASAPASEYAEHAAASALWLSSRSASACNPRARQQGGLTVDSRGRRKRTQSGDEHA
eukprot:3134183-Pyramimonas_sp.AAC.1